MSSPVTIETKLKLLQDTTLSYIDIAMLVQRKVETVRRWAWKLHVSHLRYRFIKKPVQHFNKAVHGPQIQQLYAEGKTVAEIVASTGLSRTTITHLKDRHGVRRPKPQKVNEC